MPLSKRVPLTIVPVRSDEAGRCNLRRSMMGDRRQNENMRGNVAAEAKKCANRCSVAHTPRTLWPFLIFYSALRSCFNSNSQPIF